MEFDEHEDQEEEEMGFPEPLPPPPVYDSFGNSAARSKTTEVGAAVTPGRKGGPTGTVRYRECQKNHAVSIGGHAVDGCCEFLAAGEEGTLEAVICAACNCHRNFHRKEIDGEMSSYHHHQQPRPQPLQPPLHHQYHHQFSPYYHRAPPPPSAGYLHLATPPVSQHRPLALPPVASGGGFYKEEEDMSNPSSSGGGDGAGGGGSGSGTKKRFRTKFTQEQKDKMLAFAERLGWRIQKHDEAAVEQFCAETGVKRHVLKVWMHNNKHTLGMEVCR